MILIKMENKMKIFRLILVFLLVALSSANGQFFSKSDIEIYKDDVSQQARSLVKENIDLTANQAKIFWPIYDEYRAKADSLFGKELLVLEDYLMHYYDLSENRASKLMKEAINFKREKLNLQEKYISIMSKKLPVQIVGKFFQIDNRLNLMISRQNSEKIPLVRDQDKK